MCHQYTMFLESSNIFFYLPTSSDIFLQHLWNSWFHPRCRELGVLPSQDLEDLDRHGPAHVLRTGWDHHVVADLSEDSEVIRDWGETTATGWRCKEHVTYIYIWLSVYIYICIHIISYPAWKQTCAFFFKLFYFAQMHSTISCFHYRVHSDLWRYVKMYRSCSVAIEAASFQNSSPHSLKLPEESSQWICAPSTGRIWHQLAFAHWWFYALSIASLMVQFKGDKFRPETPVTWVLAPG